MSVTNQHSVEFHPNEIPSEEGSGALVERVEEETGARVENAEQIKLYRISGKYAFAITLSQAERDTILKTHKEVLQRLSGEEAKVSVAKEPHLCVGECATQQG